MQQWYYSHTFAGSHGLPAAEVTTSTLCMNGYPYKVLLPSSRPVMSNGEEEGVLGCVVGVEVVLPYCMVYCGLVSPHRSVGGNQVILTACNISDSNETSRGAPTAAREVSHIRLHNLYLNRVHES